MSVETQRRRGWWALALHHADATPESRDRYVDFLRALSILAVVSGHWLSNVFWIEGGRLRIGTMLSIQPWTQWLTWVFQVMPVFFIVGGYANAASWDQALRRGRTYGSWAATRARRLFGPIVPLLVVWGLLAASARAFGARPEMIRAGSELALSPLWFLVVYAVVTLATPLFRSAGARLGLGSFWCVGGIALVLGALRLFFGFTGIASVFGFLKGLPSMQSLLVWAALHQVGFLWRDGKIATPQRALPWAVAGGLLMAVLILVAGYPVNLVGIPGDQGQVTPALSLLAIGLIQVGVLLALQAPARRWLAQRHTWAAVILVNSRIMSVFVWHFTVMIVILMGAWLFGGFGLHVVPGTVAWWITRPLWVAVWVAGLLIPVVFFGRFEQLHRVNVELPLWRSMLGAALVCGSLKALTVVDGPGLLGLPWDALLIALAGVATIGALSLRRGLDQSGW